MEEDEKRQHEAGRGEEMAFDPAGGCNEPEHAATSGSSSSDTDFEGGEELQRIRTTRSMALEHQFEPIRAGDRAEVTRVASLFGPQSSIHSSTSEAGLARRDTLYGVDMEHPALDPTSPNFDAYKWARM